MIQRFFLILTALITAAGCATTQPPARFQFTAHTRIGILNHLESYAIHQNFNELRFGSFSKKYDVDWNIPAYVQDQLTRILNNDPRCTVIPLKPAIPLAEPDRIDRITKPEEIKPQVATLLEELAEKNGLDVIIFVKSYRGPSPFKIGKHAIELQGYGLFTRRFLMSKKAYAYANIEVIVLKTHPLTLIGSGTPKIQSSSLSNINLVDNLKNVPQSELDKLRPIIQKYAEDAAIKALDNANLVSPK